MFSEEDLEAGVTAGIFSPAQARDFRAFLDGRQAGAGELQEEHFRLLGGFNDIFVSIAILLVLMAVEQLASFGAAPVGGLVIAAVSWAGSEFFTRRRRMALPSIVLLLAFVGGLFWGGWHSLVNLVPVGDNAWTGPLAGALLAGAGAFLHWKRFMVPITVAAGGLAAVMALIAAPLWVFPSLGNVAFGPLMFAGGLVLFLVAMAWDASDLLRRTRRSDVAFWLHLVAAPLMVHPVFGALGVSRTADFAGGALLAIGLYLLLALVALAIDRRALLVSALAYVLYATSALFRAAGSLTASFALTALVIGSALLLLSAFWQKARSLLIGRLPAGLKARLPEVRAR